MSGFTRPADKLSKYHDYYIFKEGVKEPNNWRSDLEAVYGKKFLREMSIIYIALEKNSLI